MIYNLAKEVGKGVGKRRMLVLNMILGRDRM